MTTQIITPMNEITTTEPGELAIIASQPLDQHPAAVYLAGLNSERGRRTQRQSLEVVAGILTGKPDAFACDWSALRFQHTQAIRSKLAGAYAPATANRILSALRGVLKASFLLGQMGAEEYTRAVMVKSVTGSTLPAGRELQAGEIAALMQNCEQDPTPAGARDAAIVALMYTCGLRREEVASLDLDSYDPDTGKLVVFGKRRKERTSYLVNGAARAMGDWLTIRGSGPGPLFIPINKGGKMTNRRMSNQAIYNLLAKRGGKAGVKDFSPHDMRRTFVSDLLEAGADIATVAKMAGHSSVQTTARYDRRPEEAKRKAAGLLHVPYRGRK
jgi:integrase